MNPDLQTFLQAWTGGADVSDAERQRLIQRLETDAAFRADCAEEIRLLGMIRASQTPSPRWLDLRDALGLSLSATDETTTDDLASRVLHLVQDEPRQSRKAPWGVSSPLTAAAAGLVFGLFSASMVFAYAVPRAVAMATRLSALVDGSFENADESLPSGLPEAFGVWSGKEAGQVRVDALDEARVLRFVECKRGPSAIYQLVDLRSLRIDPNEGEAKLVLSARIRDDRPEVGDPFRFSMQLYLFSGSPDSLRKDWRDARKEAISLGSAVLESRGGTPKSWRELSAKTLLPPGADFALIQIGVLDTGAFPQKSATFGEQFADDVQLTLTTQPFLPVRVAQR